MKLRKIANFLLIGCWLIVQYLAFFKDHWEACTYQHQLNGGLCSTPSFLDFLILSLPFLVLVMANFLVIHKFMESLYSCAFVLCIVLNIYALLEKSSGEGIYIYIVIFQLLVAFLIFISGVISRGLYTFKHRAGHS